jgi:Fe-S-cluster containining protein
MTGKILATAEEYIGSIKRSILRFSRTVPKYFRSSESAKIASMLTDDAIDGNKTHKFACSKGCAFCCFMQTDIFAGEAFVLAAALRDMPDAQRQDITTRLLENSAALAGMSNTERQRAKIPCAFLDLDKQSCSAYESRPTACRRWHSLDVNACKNGVACLDPSAFTTARMVGMAYREVSREPVGELHQGVLMAIDPGSERSFARGEPVFAGWTSTVVGMTDEEKQTSRNLVDGVTKKAYGLP